MIADILIPWAGKSCPQYPHNIIDIKKTNLSLSSSLRFFPSWCSQIYQMTNYLSEIVDLESNYKFNDMNGKSFFFMFWFRHIKKISINIEYGYLQINIQDSLEGKRDSTAK